MPPAFDYRGRDSSGKLQEGSLDAASREAVIAQLTSRGITPVKVTEAGASGSGLKKTMKSRVGKQRVKREELAAFCRQFHALYKGGVTIPSALTRLGQTSSNPHLGDALQSIAREIESGRTFAQAMTGYPEVFPTLFCNIVQVGEETGGLEDAFLHLSDYIELEDSTIKQLKSVMRYPITVIIAITVAFVIINAFVIPAFMEVFQESKMVLPLPTRILIATSNFILNYWGVLLVGAIAGFFGFRSYVNTIEGRLVWHRFQLRMPIFGSLMQRILFTRFARSLSMVSRTGLPVMQGLDLVAKAVGNDYMAKQIQEMRTDVARGESLLRSGQRIGIFSPLVLQMLAVGEESGSLDDALDQVASFYEREVAYDIKEVQQNMEPILLICIAAMVLLLALGVFLPIWNMSQLAGGA